MSIHIDSEDHNTPGGTRYNGIWTLNQSVSSEYTVIAQTMEVQDIPWCWTDTNEIIISVEGTEYVMAPFASADLSTYQTSTNKTTLASYWQTRLTALGSAVTPSFTCTWTYSSSTDMFAVAFNKTVTILWSESPCRGWFAKTQDETSTLFNLNAAYITITPRLIYCVIEEGNSFYTTSNNFAPTLIFSTSDTELSGQEVVFDDQTKTFTLQLFLVNVTYSTVPLTAGWELILKRS